MDNQEYCRETMAINAANLAANLENVNINEEILRAGKSTDVQIIYLLEQILKAVTQIDGK